MAKTAAAQVNTSKNGTAKNLPGHKDIETQSDDNGAETKQVKVSHYAPDVRVWTYTTKAGDVIELPLDFEHPDKMWLWRQHKKPLLSQTWAWLDKAGVPNVVQEQCMSVPDDEYLDMYNAWFEAIGGGATVGE